MVRSRWLSLALLIFLVLGVLGVLSTLTLAAVGAGGRSLSDTVDDAVDGHRFSLLDFELDSLFNGWLGDLGDFLTGRRPHGADADRLLERYFTLGADITARAAQGAGDAELAPFRAQRRTLENRAERILEARIARTYRQLGFRRPLPLFGDQALLWPPIDIELARPPRVLAVSPRDQIRLLRTVLLDPDPPLADLERIEAAIEAGGRHSAFVDTIGGLAAYPAIVCDTRTYASTVDTIAHEWLHHYLYFYPLGRAFFASDETRTINETVADLIAAEVAARLFAAYPNVRLPAPPALDRSETDSLLRRLRLDVDALLAASRIEEAERRMEEVRLQLAAAGRSLRRINQAFFAFSGVYGTRPTTSSPIGPLLQQLRAASPTLRDFVAQVRAIDSLVELEALLAASQQ